MRFVCKLVVLIVMAACKTQRVTVVATQTDVFTKQSEKDGYKCNANFTVFDVEDAVNCITCAYQCLRHERCFGVFCKHLTKQCIGCSAGFDSDIKDAWNGSVFYEGGGSSMKTSHYGIPCTTDAECLYPNTICLQSICDCKAGYRREPKNETCVLYCKNYGTTYIAYTDVMLKIPTSVFYGNLSECKNMCSSFSSCRGFNYCLHCSTSKCSMKNETPYSNPDDFVEYASTVYYSRNCVDIHA